MVKKGSPKTIPFVVGIGASAGGLEALDRVFENLPADQGDGLAYVIVQHLSPDHKSLMVDLLSKRTSLPVRQAEEDMVVEAGTVYVLPPGKTLVIRDGRLRLTAKDTRQGIVLPIDIFLHSLALECASMAAAVILSGTGSDGTRGVRAIHEHGGMVLVQDPETARFDGMPRSAMNTGIVDDVLAPEDIGQRLCAYATQAIHAVNERPIGEVQGVIHGDEVDRIIRVLMSQTGTDFSHYRRGTLVRRIERRMHLNTVDNYADYAVLLAASPHEAVNLRKELLISVTSFFRDQKVFEALRNQVIKPLVEQAEANGTLRAWVCGCASGEEAYSIGILILEAMRQAGKDLDVKIFATDIDRQALDIASAGIYPESAVADITPDLLERYFIASGDSYKVAPSLRRMVLVASHNCIKDPPFTKLDLVSCRNLLIYFEPELQQAVLGRLQFALKTGGSLMLGASEALGALSDSFAPINGRHRLYKLLAPPPLPLVTLGDDSLMPASRRGSGGLAPVQRKTRGTVIDEAARALLRHLSPPTLLVSEHFEILHNFGGAERFLRLPVGEVSLDLLKHLPPGLGALLGATLHRVFKEWREIQLQNIVVDTNDGSRETLNLRLIPVQATSSLARSALVLFHPTQAAPDGALSVDVDQVAGERIKALEAELLDSRESQQTFVEELETTNEELQATNEELLAANEELQSANEELQSVNEELYTVNAELNEKVEELTRLNADLDNLMEATDIGIVFLDEKGHVRRFTPAVTSVVNLIERDVGRPIFDLSTNLVDAPLFDHIRQVLENGQVLECEAVCADGRAMLVRLHPYHHDNGRPMGVIVTFVDVSPLKAAQARLQMYMDSLPHEMAVLDHNGTIVLVNAAWMRFAQENGARLDRVGPGCDYFAVCRGDGDGSGDSASAIAAEQGLRDILFGRRSSFTFEYPCHSPDKSRWFMMTAAPTTQGGAVISHIDITDRKRSEDQMRLTASVFDSSGEAIMITDQDEKIVSVNPAFCQMTGYAAEEIIGQTPRILASGRHDRAFYHEMWTSLRDTGIWRGEVWNRRRNGQVFPEWLTISSVRNAQGKVINYVAVFSDISERKATEQRLLDINSELEQFAYVASHDLREPLRMVSSYLKLIERRLGDMAGDELRDFMHFAIDGAKRMDSLILNLLEYSRIGRMESEAVPVRLDDVLASVVASFQPILDERGGDCQVKGGGYRVLGHDNQLSRLFQNIIGNALKYSDAETVPRIVVECSRSGNFILVEIADNGIGIPDDQQDKVFRMFQRLHPRDAYGGGTGIGLAVCKKIVDYYGGRIWLESMPGHGTKFFCTLPAADLAAE
ncbi:MAG: PAS domain S-box protein [Magnetospirillum sp.]|nr:PAS domain S-box protein [Magnetospirillum sp.]